MTLFASPEEHVAHPPRTWRAVKRGNRWLMMAGDIELGSFATKREALTAIDHGWARHLYDKETAWYAGRTVTGWRPWADVKAESEATRASRPGSGV